jgi:hypothetical protein
MSVSTRACCGASRGESRSGTSSRIAIEESLDPERTVFLHRRAVAALAEPAIGAPDLARLAHHAEAAGDTGAVLRFAPAAAQEASKVGAHREAAAQCARALRFAGGVAPVVRAELLESYADECYLTDMRGEGLAALDEALSIHAQRDDALKQGETQERRAKMLLCIGRVEEATAAAHDAVVVLEPLAPGRELARAYSAMAEIAMHTDDGEGGIRWGGMARALAERVGDVDALALALNCVGNIELGRGDPEGRVKLVRSIELAKRAGMPGEVGRGYINLLGALGRSHQWASAGELIEAGMEWCREHGLEAWLRYIVERRPKRIWRRAGGTTPPRRRSGS